MREQNDGRRATLIAWSAALATFGAGFVVMGLWSLFLDHSPSLPSFSDYLSGTLGDGLFLPVTVYGLFLAKNRHPVMRSPHQHLFLYTAGIAGAIVGILSHASWYTDPAPKLNWMLPEPHHFSPVGWYHAVFLTMTSTVVAATFCGLLINLRSALRGDATARGEAQSLLRSNGAALLVSAAGLFVTTVVVDSARSSEGLATYGTLGALPVALVLVLGLVLLMLGRSALLLTGPLATAIVAAIVLWECALGSVRDSPAFVPWVLAAISAGTAVAFLKYPRSTNHSSGADGENLLTWAGVRFTLLPAATVLVAIETARLPSMNWWIMALLALIAVLDSIIIWRRPEAAFTVRAITIFLFVIVSIALGTTLHKYGSQVTDVVGFLVPGFVVLYLMAGVQQFWVVLADAERKERNEVNRDNVLRDIGLTNKVVWTLSIGLAMAVFLAIIPLAVLAVDSKTITLSGQNRIDWSLPLAVLVWAAIVVLLTLPEQKLMFARRSLPEDMPDERNPMRVWNRWTTALALGIGAFITTVMTIQVGWHGFISVIALSITLAIGFDTAVTTIMDSTFMCMESPTRLDVVTSSLAGLVAGGIIYWAILTGVGSGGLSLGMAVVLLLGAVLVRSVVVFAAAAIIYAGKSSWYATDRAPGWNHFQNEGLRALMVIALLWLPAFVFTHSNADYAFVNMLKAGSAPLFLAGGFLPWASEQNMRHYADQCRLRFNGRFAGQQLTGSWFAQSIELVRNITTLEFNTPIRDKQATFIRALGAHLALQVLVRLTVVISSIVGVIAYVFAGLLLKTLPIKSTTRGLQ
ncbi:MAG: hypothetical protein ACRDYX_16105 [Egibacteraceae bacterium]